MSVIQVTQESANEEEEVYPFWTDLNTVFRRGLKKKQLIHTTRWQLTSFKDDVDGDQARISHVLTFVRKLLFFSSMKNPQKAF